MIKRLPDAEFEVMKAVWNSTAPMGANMIMEQLGTEKSWKVQTVISLLHRLVERGFVQSEKIGKDRVYTPIISREEYLKSETDAFVKQYHDNSVVSLFNALYESKSVDENDTNELLSLIKKLGEK